MGLIMTYRDEMLSKFIRASFDNWDQYLETLRKMGDIDLVPKRYNDAAEAY